MLVEVKAKVARIIDGKTRKRNEAFITEKEIFAEAELAVMQNLIAEKDQGLIEDYEIQSLRISPIKEVAPQFDGNYSFVATLRDIWLDNDGTEKTLRYKVLLWADDLAQANQHISKLAKQGYDMQIEGIKQVDYDYLTPQDNGAE